MRTTIGAFKGMSVGRLVLTKPDYTAWMLGERHPGRELARLKAEAVRLISVFDAKPIVGPCDGRDCARPAVRFSAYAGNPSMLYQWCRVCDPYEAGASIGKLTIVAAYGEALRHIERTCGGLKSGSQAIITAIARRKGLPKRLTEAAIDRFFA